MRCSSRRRRTVCCAQSFEGTKGNSREIDIAGLGLLKAKVKEGTRPVDRLGLCECRNGRLGLVTVAVI